ncbi:TetR/AcrR family transcriptional regulator [Sneathiella aquimaris]|uniref:TetR/AcrR family transcriptional regulator n=1 Tax=Sneathiella aquimaris TaxID=2599305 RepID=UPI001469E736|nr:TetR/AcrR family transcriptional regulator [Sneathiella aquimaris]
MPWEKSFDLDDAVDRAQFVFWSKGYEATSITDLTKSMGINKGSLYNAFGSKKDLFTRALLKYDRDNRQASIATLEAYENPHDAIETLFDGLIAQSLADDAYKGCFLVNTALDLPNHSDDIRDMVNAALDDFVKFFERMITKGQTQNVIPSCVEAHTTAKSLLSLVVGLRVLARGAYDEAGLRAIKQDALKLISEPKSLAN